MIRKYPFKQRGKGEEGGEGGGDVKTYVYKKIEKRAEVGSVLFDVVNRDRIRDCFYDS